MGMNRQFQAKALKYNQVATVSFTGCSKFSKSVGIQKSCTLELYSNDIHTAQWPRYHEHVSVICIPKINFVGQGKQYLDHEQDMQSYFLLLWP